MDGSGDGMTATRGLAGQNGSKPLPADERRDQVFSVKLTADEKRLLEDTDARTWARDVLLKSARRRR